jgi:hypothetical protein
MANFDTWRADPLSEAILEQSSVASAELEVSMLERASSVVPMRVPMRRPAAVAVPVRAAAAHWRRLRRWVRALRRRVHRAALPRRTLALARRP